MAIPTTYDPKLAMIIIERLADGETLNTICRGQAEMPHPKTFKRWLVKYPELRNAYEVAMTASARSMEEEALDAAREIARNRKDGTHVRAVEVKLAQLRWTMEKRDKARFGPSAQVNVRVPIQIVTPLNLGAGDGTPMDDIYTLEAVTVKEPPEPSPTVGGRLALPPPAHRGKVKLTPRNPMWTVGDKSGKRRNVRQRSSEGSEQGLAGTGGQGLPAQEATEGSEDAQATVEAAPSAGENR